MRTLAPGPEALWVCEGESPGAEGLGGWRARAGGSGALLSPLTCAAIPSGGLRALPSCSHQLQGVQSSPEFWELS